MIGMEVRSAGVWSNLQHYSVQSHLQVTMHQFIFRIDYVSYRKKSPKKCLKNISLHLLVRHFHPPSESLTTTHEEGKN